MSFLDMHWMATPVTIAQNGTQSTAFNTGGRGVAAIYVPTGWTAADLTLKGMPPVGSTPVSISLDDGNQPGVLQANMTHGEIIFLAPDGIGVGYPGDLYFVSSNAQAAARDIYVLLRGF